jgi:hypothetical protein
VERLDLLVQAFRFELPVGVRWRRRRTISVQIVNPNMVGFTTGRYGPLTTEVRLSDMQGMTAGQLPTASTVKNGSRAFASDGTPGTNPLTGSGSGCWAVVRDGAWVTEDTSPSATARDGCSIPSSLPLFGR